MTKVYYPFHASAWLGAKWAIHPPTCDECGTRTVVCMAASESEERWWADCLNCHPADRVVLCPFKDTKEPIIVLICEVPALLGGSSDAPNLSVHVRPGSTVTAGTLSRAGQSFQGLVAARLDKAKNPRKWALELREDDRVWAPSDPRGGTWRRGEALPLRSTILRKKVRRRRTDDVGHGTCCQCGPCKAERAAPSQVLDGRKCFGCESPLTAGQTAWKADPPPKGNRWSTHDWSSDGLRVLWCPSCVAAVHTREEAQPEETVVRHMRVIEGGQS